MTLSQQISVTAPPIKFVKDLKSISVFENEAALLSCTVSDNFGQVDWYFNGQLLSEILKENENLAKRFKIISDGPVRKIIISNAQLRDTGFYECKHTDSELTSCKFEVQKPPIEVIEPLENLDITTGQTAEMICVISREVKNIEWYHGTLPIDSTNIEFQKRIVREVYLETNPENTKYFNKFICKIKFQKCFPRDSGIISLRGEDVTISQGVLDISDPPIHFTQHLKDITVEVGKTAILSCEVSDVLANVIWHKNNIPINPVEMDSEDSDTNLDAAFNNISFENTKCVRNLVIQKCTMADQATYTCLTTDNRRTYCQLNVKLPDIDFVEELKDLQVYMGDDIENKVVINSTVLGKSVQWYFDGEPIEKFKNLGLVETFYDFDTYEIKIKGDLICEMTHSLEFKATEYVSCCCQISVEKKPIKWEVLLPDTEVREQRDLTLRSYLKFHLE